MQEFDKILDRREKVLWTGKPRFWPFFLSITPSAVFGLFFFLIGLLVIADGLSAGNPWFILIPHFWIGVFMVFGAPIYRLLVFNHTHYAITDKRILFQGGVVGRDFEMLDFDQITNADVTVGVLDKIFGGGSGSISLASAGTFTYTRRGAILRPYTIRNIPNPYEVFKFFKKVSHDVKTDIEYPNKYRPRTNPGYRTTYRPGK